MQRKPLKMGLDFIRGDGWVIKTFSPRSAQTYLDKVAAKSPLRGAVGLLSDAGAYFVGSVAAQPFSLSTGK